MFYPYSEYDPYKYDSFAVNAGGQIYRLTKVIDQRMTELSKDGAGVRLPPILAFQSLADATVSTEDLVKVLFRRLAPNLQSSVRDSSWFNI